MRSFVAIVLACWMLGGSLLPGFSIDQTAHLGSLADHYREHCKTDVDLSFYDFLRMHYGADSEHQKHPTHSHQHLPSIGHSVPVYTPPAIRLVAPALLQAFFVTKSTFDRQTDLYSFLAVFSLINPPRR